MTASNTTSDQEAHRPFALCLSALSSNFFPLSCRLRVQSGFDANMHVLRQRPLIATLTTGPAWPSAVGAAQTLYAATERQQVVTPDNSSRDLPLSRILNAIALILNRTMGVEALEAKRISGASMEIQPIPSHKNAFYIRYEDTWHGDVFCPFCGTKSVDFVSGELEASVCPHIVFAETDCEVLHIADVFLRELKKLVPSVTEEMALSAGTVPWPDFHGDGVGPVSIDSFCIIVPNSITIATFDSETGEERTLSFVPADVHKSTHSDVKPIRLN